MHALRTEDCFYSVLYSIPFHPYRCLSRAGAPFYSTPNFLADASVLLRRATNLKPPRYTFVVAPDDILRRFCQLYSIVYYHAYAGRFYYP